MATSTGPVPPEQRLPIEVVTDRLTIRQWTAEDAPLLHEAITANVEHLRPWMPWIAFEPLSVDDRRKLIEEWERSHLEGGDATLGVFLDGTAIGGTGLHKRIGPGGIEIGYWVDHRHEGHGYVTEWVRALTTAALGEPGIERVEIHHDIANVRSGRVPERLGYEHIGTEEREIATPGEAGTTVLWRMKLSAWAE